MKKLLISLLLLFSMAACTTETTPAPTAEPTPEPTAGVAEYDSLTVISPMGAPAVSLVQMAVEGTNEIEFVSGADLLKAAFVNPEPQYDVIVAPSNLGAMLASSGKTTYKMLGIVTWGNLYMLGTDAAVLDNPEARVAVFGESAVPGLVFEAVVADKIAGTVEYYGSVQEAQAALLSGNADAALIAEPAATATIAKAKSMDLTLMEVADLQALWQEEYGSEGFAQAAVFVSDAALTEKADAIANFETELAAGIAAYADASATEQLTADVEAIGADVLGVPSAAIISKTYNRMNLRYEPAKDNKEALDSFLKLFNITDPSTYIVE